MDSGRKDVMGMASRRAVLGSFGFASLMTVGGGFFSRPASAETSVPATARQKCATCRFWGGARTLSADKASVIASGKGTCNNPKSPAYQKQTRPDQGAPVWERWDALG